MDTYKVIGASYEEVQEVVKKYPKSIEFCILFTSLDSQVYFRSTSEVVEKHFKDTFQNEKVDFKYNFIGDRGIRFGVPELF